MKVVALLPMKGHSERVPNKNLKMFAGKTLYHSVMQALQDSEYVQKTVINTDSDAIADNVREELTAYTRHQLIHAFNVHREEGEEKLSHYSTQAKAIDALLV